MQQTFEQISDDFFCNFPLHHIKKNVSLQECSSECLVTRGCQSFNFRGSIKMGDCVIVAPSVSNVTVDIDLQYKWGYYGLF